uniref:Uncharacterized protein n=1 Tax=Panagrolaimus sp. JU765 TaxID=591449 RepID=A0AC34R5U5_9BILA
MCARRIIFILAILSVLGHTHFIPKQRPVLPEKSENDNIEGKMEEYGRVVMKRDAEFLAAPTVPPEEGMPGWVIGMIAFCVVVSVA